MLHAGRVLVGVLAAGIIAACSSSAPLSDSGAADQLVSDASASDGAREASLPEGGAPDAARPPTRWKTLSGSAPRVSRHTLTLLHNGDVLVAGGLGPGGDQDLEQRAAYRYVAAKDQFELAGQMGTARAFHTASLLPDGRVLVAGGHSETEYLASSEIFDPDKPVASAWSAGPAMFSPTSEHAAVTLPDGKVLLSGGWSYGVESHGKLALYDPASNSWQVPVALLNAARRGHTATLLPNGKVLFAGGKQGDSSDSIKWTALDTLEVLDPSLGKVKLLDARMSLPRAAHTADLLHDGRVLLVGGDCYQACAQTTKWADDLYDPAADSVTALAHGGPFPSDHASALLGSGQLLVIGGEVDDISSVMALNPGPPASWSKLPPLAAGRIFARAVTLPDNTVLVVGGWVPAPVYTWVTTAERFVP